MNRKTPHPNTCTIEPVANKIDAALSLLERRTKNQDTLAGLPTGFYDIDTMTDGLQPSQLIVIAARPAVGKSTLARNIAELISIEKKLPVAIFSMTESTQFILTRMIASISQVDNIRIRTGKLLPAHWEHIQNATESIKQAPLYIDDSPTHTCAELRSKAIQIKAQHNDLALLVVDELTKISYSDDSIDPFQKMVLVCTELKKLAQELNIPIIAISPLSTKTDLRQDNWPTLADLPQSPAIEQIADTVILIYRDEYYHPDSKHRGEAQIIFAKNNSGPTGTVELLFQSTIGRFLNWEKDPKQIFKTNKKANPNTRKKTK
jgi:replicative DNA helicase